MQKIVEKVCTLRNGVQMPYVGLGTWQLSDPKKCTTALQHCFKAGYTLIDTGSIYRNETIIGKELSKFPGYGDGSLITANKKGIFVTSKASPTEMGYQKVYDACTASLQRLGQTSLDLYLLHWPGTSRVPNDSPIHRVIRAESWKAMEKLYAEGKVRAIGVSNFLSSHLEMLIQDGVQEIPFVDQVELHPLCPNYELRKTAKSFGIAIQAYSSLGTGDFKLLQDPIVLEVANNESKTPTQVLLRWAVQQQIMVIPRSTQLAHLEQNLDVTNIHLTDESMLKLNKICPSDTDSKRFCWDPSTIL